MDKFARPMPSLPPRAAWHRWQNWLVAVVALWLLSSPEVIAAISSRSHAGGQNDPAIWNAWLVGFLGLVVAGIGLVVSRPWPSVLMLGLAAWLAISPWELGYEHLAFWTWNAILSGCAIGISEAVVLLDRYGLLPSLLSEASASRPVESSHRHSVVAFWLVLMDRISALLKTIQRDRLRPGR